MGQTPQFIQQNFFALSSDLPIKIEIIDDKDQIAKFVEVVEKMFDKSKSAGLIAVQDINVVNYISK
ncbi:MAG: DUF190 domain-containing protein [Chloroflexia bacterium]|nr:DUF190 domain-containing protein [Chloroflexia bacterium]